MRATIVGFGRSSPAGPSEPTLIPNRTAFDPPDADSLGRHPSVDLWAAAVTVLQMIDPCATSTDNSFDSGSPLEAFFRTALASAARHRFASARAMADAWQESAEKERLLTDPAEWSKLSHSLQAAAVRLGLEVRASENPIDLARRLMPFGLSHNAVRDIEMLREVKHDLRGDGDRFRDFADAITEELARMDVSR